MTNSARWKSDRETNSIISKRVQSKDQIACEMVLYDLQVGDLNFLNMATLHPLTALRFKFLMELDRVIAKNRRLNSMGSAKLR